MEGGGLSKANSLYKDENYQIFSSIKNEQGGEVGQNLTHLSERTFEWPPTFSIIKRILLLRLDETIFCPISSLLY